MARKVNATFVGSTDRQTDPGAVTNADVLENAVGDTAYVHDMLTGDNSPAVTVNHTGSGAGVPLGLPLGNSVVILRGRVPITGTAPERVNSVRASSSNVNRIYLFMVPIYLPEGETSLSVGVDIDDGESIELVVRNTSFTDAGEPTQATVGPSGRWQGDCTGLTGGNVYFVGLKTEVGPLSPTKFWTGLRIFFGGAAVDHYETPPGDTDASFPQVPVASQAAPGGAVVIDQTDWDAAMFATDIAIHSQLTSRLNENQGAIGEFLSGLPAGGNAAYTLTSSSGDDPASSAFHDHSVSTHANEGEIDFPILAVPLGAVRALDLLPTYETVNWGAPRPTGVSKRVIADDVVQMPDFPDGTSTSRLKCTVLLASPDGSQVGKNQITVYAQATGATSGAGTEQSSNISSFGIGSTDWDVVTIGGSGGRIDFDGGETNYLTIQIADGGAGTQAAAVAIVGYCWYFDRDG